MSFDSREHALQEAFKIPMEGGTFLKADNNEDAALSIVVVAATDLPSEIYFELINLYCPF